MQIANYADFCNECGNCDTFCPEYGGPYIQKPGFYGTIESWKKAKPRDGFVVSNGGTRSTIYGRIKGAEYELSLDRGVGVYRFRDGGVELTLSAQDHSVKSAELVKAGSAERVVDLGIYHTLRHLMAGVLDMRYLNQVNAASFESV